MAATQDDNETRIVVIGDANLIPIGLAAAIRDEGWHWCAYADPGALVATGIGPRTVVILLIETFTMASLGAISELALSRGLPVVVLGLEHHPMIVRAVLEAGAEDIMVIPASIEEVLARMRAIIRVRLPVPDTEGARSIYHLDEAERTISLPGGAVSRLTLPEYRIFKILLAAPNQPVSRDYLRSLLTPFTRSHTSATLDTTIGRLRRKLGPSRVRTIRGVGYQLVDEDASEVGPQPQ